MPPSSHITTLIHALLWSQHTLRSSGSQMSSSSGKHIRSPKSPRTGLLPKKGDPMMSPERQTILEESSLQGEARCRTPYPTERERGECTRASRGWRATSSCQSSNPTEEEQEKIKTPSCSQNSAENVVTAMNVALNCG